MRNPAWLLVLVALPGCYLFHGAAEGDDAGGPPVVSVDASIPSIDATTPRDAGRDAMGPPVIHPPGTGGYRDAGPGPTFVPDGSVLFVERPNEGVTCDDGDEVMAALCGALPVLYLAADGRSGGTGTAADPFGAFDAAITACGAACELRIERGEVPVRRTVFPDRSCVSISGGWARDGATWTATEARTVLLGPIVGSFLQTPARLLVERVSLVGAVAGIGAVAPSDLLVVRDVDLDVSGVGIWSEGSRDIASEPTATGARVCRTRIRSEVNGIQLGQHTRDAIVESVEIEASESDGVSISGGSARILIRDTEIRAAVGVRISVPSRHVVIEQSHIDAGDFGVSIGGSHVLIAESTVLGCDTPIGAHGTWMQIVDTVTGECTIGE